MKPGQVYRIANCDPPHFFRVVTADLAKERARVVSCKRSGEPIAGRKPYGVTTRSVRRGRYLLHSEK